MISCWVKTLISKSLSGLFATVATFGALARDGWDSLHGSAPPRELVLGASVLGAALTIAAVSRFLSHAVVAEHSTAVHSVLPRTRLPLLMLVGTDLVVMLLQVLFAWRHDGSGLAFYAFVALLSALAVLLTVSAPSIGHLDARHLRSK